MRNHHNQLKVQPQPIRAGGVCVVKEKKLLILCSGIKTKDCMRVLVVGNHVSMFEVTSRAEVMYCIITSVVEYVTFSLVVSFCSLTTKTWQPFNLNTT